MAIITVTKQDAIDILSKKMMLDEMYSFKEISTILKENFEGITNSQVSGLIHRLSNGIGTFLSTSQILEISPDKIYQLNPNWENKDDIIKNSNNSKEYTKDELIILSNEILEKNILQLNNLKTKIHTPENFVWLQNKINEIETLITKD